MSFDIASANYRREIIFKGLELTEVQVRPYAIEYLGDDPTLKHCDAKTALCYCILYENLPTFHIFDSEGGPIVCY